MVVYFFICKYICPVGFICSFNEVNRGSVLVFNEVDRFMLGYECVYSYLRSECIMASSFFRLDKTNSPFASVFECSIVNMS